MKFSSPFLSGVSLVLLLAFGSEARADLIPWAYNWSRSPGELHADAPGTGYITLTDESEHTVVGSSDIVATNLKTFSTASPTNPDIFTAKAYSLTLTLTDLNSGISGSVTFTGAISGSVSDANSNLQNAFTGMTTQELILGNSLFTTTIGPFTPPGPPGTTNFGSISGHATVTVSTITPVSIPTVPEPSSLALSAIGVAIVGAGRRWLRGRKRRAVK